MAPQITLSDIFLLTGNIKIDEDHKAVIQLVNRFFANVYAKNRTHDELENDFNYIAQILIDHFYYETQLVEKVRDKQAAEMHEIMYNTFLTEVSAAVIDLLNGKGDLQAACDYVQTFLFRHCLLIANYIKE